MDHRERDRYRQRSDWREDEDRWSRRGSERGRYGEDGGSERWGARERDYDERYRDRDYGERGWGEMRDWESDMGDRRFERNERSYGRYGGDRLGDRHDWRYDSENQYRGRGNEDWERGMRERGRGISDPSYGRGEHYVRGMGERGMSGYGRDWMGDENENWRPHPRGERYERARMMGGMHGEQGRGQGEWGSQERHGRSGAPGWLGEFGMEGNEMRGGYGQRYYQIGVGGLRGQHEQGQGGQGQHHPGMLGRLRGRGNSPKGYKRSDERIKEDVCDRLMMSEVDASEIEVEVQNAEVILKGTVTDREHKYEVERIAESVSGVNDVQNQIRVKTDEQWRRTNGNPTEIEGPQNASSRARQPTNRT